MAFNFNTNLFELMTKFNQFKSLLNQSKQNPNELLTNELKRRNMSESEIQEMVQAAKSLQKILGVK